MSKQETQEQRAARIAKRRAYEARPDVAARLKEAKKKERERFKNSPEKRAAKRAYMRSYYKERYREDPAFRQAILTRSKEWYDGRKADPEFRKRQRESTNRWREQNPDSNKDPEFKARQRMRSRRKRYNLTHPEFMAMLERQAGLCAICTKPLKPGKSTQVDHCHKTGRIRSLLCIYCNLLVGRLEGPLVAEAFAYIRAHASRGYLE